MGKTVDYSNYINTTHGQLTIISISKHNREYVASCQCSCGTITERTSLTRLLKGQRSSCKNCSSRINGALGCKSRSKNSKNNELVGTQVHYFTVLGRSTIHPGCFECRCICGTIRHLDAHALTTSDQKSCGCQQSRLLSLANGGTGISNDGITTNEFIRKNSLEYPIWVKACLDKHKYTCFVSGQIGGNLNVHHITPLSGLLQLYGITKNNYKEFTDVLFDIANGIVLSQDVHKQIHNKYGVYVSVAQLIEFKNDYLPKQ